MYRRIQHSFAKLNHDGNDADKFYFLQKNLLVYIAFNFFTHYIIIVIIALVIIITITIIVIIAFLKYFFIKFF